MRELTDQQKEALYEINKQLYNIEQRIWGLLPPSHQRDSARIRLHNARADLESLFFYYEEGK
jgi:hypothetical protein